MPSDPAIQHSFQSAEQLARESAAAITQLAATAIASRGVFRIALSGGSTPQRLYGELARAPIDWSRVELFWGDERNVPHDDPQSNYRMVRLALLEPAHVPSTSAMGVPTHLPSPSDAAWSYERTLRDRFHEAADGGWPRWDLVLLGLGDDSHTASLFPHTKALHETGRWFVANDVPQHQTTRLTLTYPAINSAAAVWFLVAGRSKRGALETVWQGRRSIDDYPAQGIDPTDGELHWWLAID
jgi:6-phosphogluconolactonase